MLLVIVSAQNLRQVSFANPAITLSPMSSSQSVISSFNQSHLWAFAVTQDVRLACWTGMPKALAHGGISLGGKYQECGAAILVRT